MSEKDIEDAEIVVEPVTQPACDSSCDIPPAGLSQMEQAPPPEGVIGSTDTPAAVTDSEMKIGESRFGVTCTGNPVGRSHWLADSSACGDLVMALPSSVLIAARTTVGGGVAVDMGVLLDSIVEGVGKFNGYAGVAEAASLPLWSVCRLMGTFPVLKQVFSDCMDEAVVIVEGAAWKAAIGSTVKNERKMSKVRRTPEGSFAERSTETLTKHIPPDPALSKLILTSRMKGRYKDEGGMRQAVQINISAAEANV